MVDPKLAEAVAAITRLNLTWVLMGRTRGAHVTAQGPDDIRVGLRYGNESSSNWAAIEVVECRIPERIIYKADFSSLRREQESAQLLAEYIAKIVSEIEHNQNLRDQAVDKRFWGRRSFQKVCKCESGGDRFHLIRLRRNQSTVNE
jgi:hypothetical protein